MASLANACAIMKPEDQYKPALEKVSFGILPGWTIASNREAVQSLINSCEEISRRPRNKLFFSNPMWKQNKDWQAICFKTLLIDSDAKAKLFFEHNFDPYLVTNKGNPEGLFTGYYEIEVKGSLNRDDIYKYPIYAKPLELEKVSKYLSREKIDQGALNNRGLEIAWLSSPVDVLFLQVQGSGKIRLPNEEILRVHYSGRNGYDYYPIGKYMVEKGYINKDRLSAQAIRDWLDNHIDQAQALIEKNQSYIFFKLADKEGPEGAEGIPLTAQRSIAVDTRFVPFGTPIWLDIVPRQGFDDHGLHQLVIAQDTGSAIKGPIRGDVFFGAGSYAEDKAGSFKNEGRYFVLLPKNGI